MDMGSNVSQVLSLNLQVMDLIWDTGMADDDDDDSVLLFFLWQGRATRKSLSRSRKCSSTTVRIKIIER